MMIAASTRSITPPSIIGWVPLDVVSWSDTQIVATIPMETAAGTLQLQVNVHGLTAGPVDVTISASPSPD